MKSSLDRPGAAMEPPRRPRLEPRLVFVAVMVAIPLLWLMAQAVLVRPGESCEDSAVGGLGQMFVPGVGCEQEPVPGARPR
jgi:hypothetical protein